VKALRKTIDNNKDALETILLELANK